MINWYVLVNIEHFFGVQWSTKILCNLVAFLQNETKEKNTLKISILARETNFKNSKMV
jgi:hypothetical protein